MNEEYMSDIGSAHRLFPDDTLKKDMHEPKQHHAVTTRPPAVLRVWSALAERAC